MNVFINAKVNNKFDIRDHGDRSVSRDPSHRRYHLFYQFLLAVLDIHALLGYDGKTAALQIVDL